MSRRFKTVLYILGASILLSCGLCGGCLYQAYRDIPAVEAASVAFLDRLVQGKIDEAYESTAPALRKEISLERFRS